MGSILVFSHIYRKCRLSVQVWYCHLKRTVHSFKKLSLILSQKILLLVIAVVVDYCCCCKASTGICYCQCIHWYGAYWVFKTYCCCCTNRIYSNLEQIYTGGAVEVEGSLTSHSNEKRTSLPSSLKLWISPVCITDHQPVPFRVSLQNLALMIFLDTWKTFVV